VERRKEAFMLGKFTLAIAFVLIASVARAADAFDMTIYNPNVSFPSYGDLQSLRFLKPDFGLREELHLGRGIRPLEDNAVPESPEEAD
jgi:hypothetical protein